MSDLENKLNELLSDPDAMAQIMQLAQSLGGGGSTEKPASEPQEAGPADSASVLSQLADGLDPELLGRLLPAIRQLNRPESSETTALLYALRPFLRPERQEKVERAAQLAKLIHLAKVFFFGGSTHV